MSSISWLIGPLPIPAKRFETMRKMSNGQQRHLRSPFWFVPIIKRVSACDCSEREIRTHLFLRSEVVDDVEETTDLFRGLPFDHVRHRLAANIAANLKGEQFEYQLYDSQERLDIEIICGKDDLEKHLLVNSDKLLVPFADIGCPLAGLVLVLVGICTRQRLTPVVFAVLNDLCRSRASANVLSSSTTKKTLI